MKVKIIMLLTLWATIGCAEAPEDPWYYANEFLQDAVKYNAYPAMVKFEFVKGLRTKQGILANGICHCSSNVISLNTEAWGRYGEWVRRGLIYHEMGHCSLRIGCESGSEHPANGLIMYPYIKEPKFYRENWDNLVDILFKEHR